MAKISSSNTSKNKSNEVNYWNYNARHSKSEIKTLSIIPNTDFFVSLGKNEKELRIHDISQINSPLISVIEGGNGTDDISCLDTYMLKGITGCKDLITHFDFANGGEKISEFNCRTTMGNSNVVGCKFINEKLIATWSKDKTFLLYDLRKDNNKDNKPHVFQMLGDHSFTSVAYSGNYISVGDVHGKITSIDLRDLEIHEDEVSKYAINSIESYHGDIILSLDTNGGIRMYNLKSQNILTRYTVDNGYSSHHRNDGYDSDFVVSDDDDDQDEEDHRGKGLKYNAQFIEDSNKIINGTDIGEVQVSSLTLSPSGKLPYSTSNEDPLVTEFYPTDKTTKKINIVKYDKLKQRLVACSIDGQIHIWDKLVL